ncbi:MAG: hypothetical protein E7620_03610 [Ruminococcaceae bacterium]|nr:hypothetical protein [Oscillospiraceae bacterium]
MKKNVLKLLALSLISAMALTACASPAAKGDFPQNAQEAPAKDADALRFEDLAASESTAPSPAATYSVNTMAELRALSVSGDAVIYLRGFHEIGDGGGGNFYWDAESKAPDNGGTVIKPDQGGDTGRYIRVCEPTNRNVKWFGAVGSGKKDDTAALQAAIDSLPQNGGTLVIPGGTYVVTSTLNIGNGDGGEKFSTMNGVKLVGQGAGFSVTGSSVPTTIVAGKAMPCVIRVNGRISDLVIQDLCISGNNAAQIGLSMTATSGMTIRDVRIQQFSKIGMEIMGGDLPTGNYNIANRFETVQIVSSMNGTTALLIDGVYDAHNDTWLTVFNNCTFDTVATTDSYGAIFRFVDSISFYRCQFGGTGEGSVGILFDALKNKNFPCGIAFYDCSVSSTQVLEDEDHQIRKNYFYGFCTSNGEEIPTHNRLIGITDTGKPFNMDDLAFSGDSSGSGGSGLPAKRGAVDTYQSATQVHRNLAAEKEEIGIHFNAAGHFKGASFYLPSYSNSTGTIKIQVYKWNGTYSETKKGEVLYTHEFVDFPDNTYQRFEMETGLEPGEYLLVITGSSPDGDYGCGVWTQKASATVETYSNGYLADFGVQGQLLIE